MAKVQLVHPLASRYSSEEMQTIFSDQYKFSTWRKCWIALAEAELELGLPNIKPEFIAAMKQLQDDIPFDRANELEKKLRHDVMAHIHAYKEQLDGVCPGAGGIVHLGATSMFPCDNTELIQIKEGLELVIGKIVNVLRRMKPFAEQYAETPCLAWTHLQSAQPTTYGKRISDWMFGVMLALDRVVEGKDKLRARGEKGTTGTQDSFLKLFDGDETKARRLDEILGKKLGFEGTYSMTTQTYNRVIDFYVLSCLTGLAVVSKKTGGDMRQLQHIDEVAEPQGKSQVGSSAMAYKRNPMRSERLCALGRHLLFAPSEAAAYAAEQLLERTLDDSAERRIVLTDSFLGADAVLNLMLDIYTPDSEKQYGFRVFPKVAYNNLMKQMPFIVTETVLMHSVSAGGDRQVLHEIIRKCSMAARESMDQGGPNNMLELMADHPELKAGLDYVKDRMDPMMYVGSAPSQTRRFLAGQVEPLLTKYNDVPHMDGGVKV